MPQTTIKNFTITQDIIRLQCIELQKNFATPVFFLDQVHGNKVINTSLCQEKDSFMKIKADAMFSQGFHQMTLAIRIADCIPILFFSKKYKIIGCIHAGWRGLNEHIIKKTITKIQHELKIPVLTVKNLTSFRFWIGPHIQKYEVGKDVYALFSKKMSSKSQRNTRNLNLFKIVKHQFKKLGVEKTQIIFDKYYSNTLNSNDFYSHRLGDLYRNFATISFVSSKPT